MRQMVITPPTTTLYVSIVKSDYYDLYCEHALLISIWTNGKLVKWTPT